MRDNPTIELSTSSYAHWASRDVWSLRQACALVLGRDPNCRGEDPDPVLQEAREQLFRMASQSIFDGGTLERVGNGSGFDGPNIRPVDFVRWCEGKYLEMFETPMKFPDSFKKLIPQMIRVDLPQMRTNYLVM